MEVEIDTEIFGKIARAEYDTAIASIGKRGWRAVVASHERLDRVIEVAAQKASSKAACQAGCWYCCYYKVDVRAEEVFRIVDFVRSNFKSDRAKRLRDDVAENANIMRDLSREARLAANLKCPFLDEGTCSIYAARPRRCRTFHAMDVAGCKKSYEEPTNLGIPNTFNSKVFTAGEAQVDGFTKALVDSGYDTEVYELNLALAKTLTDSKPRRRFEKRKKALPGLAR